AEDGIRVRTVTGVQTCALPILYASPSSEIVRATVNRTGSNQETMPNHPTLASLAADLDTGRTTARKLVEDCLARIADPAGEGARTFIHVDKDAAFAAADAMDHLRKARAAPSSYAGIPVSIKDLYDIKGQVTRAGSRALEDSAPAE